MIPVKIQVPATVKLRHLQVACGGDEIMRVKRECDKMPREELVPERVYEMKVKFSAN